MSGIIVNIRCLSTGYLTGVQRYTAELVKRIPQLEPIVSKLEGLRGHAWEQAILPTLLRGRLLWSPANTGPLAVEKQVVTIHDLSVVDRPEGFSLRFREFYRFLLPRLTRRVRAIFGRGDSFSFSQRFSSIAYALRAFSDFPVFGLGINSMTVYSLPFWLLANTGIFGFISFCVFYASLFRSPLALLRKLSIPSWLWGLALGSLFALLSLLFITTLTGFPYVFGYFWLPILLAMSQRSFIAKSNEVREQLLVRQV